MVTSPTFAAWSWQVVRPEKSVVRANFCQIAMEDVSLPIPQCGAVRIVKAHGPVLYRAFEVQLLCSQGESSRPIPFSWVQLFYLWRW